MKIDEFPVEILMQIFSYLPKHENVLLVNRRFYNVACKVCDPTVSLEFDEELFEKKNRALLRSIQYTSRKITNIKVRFMRPPEAKALKSAMAILKIFSTTIKYFWLNADLEMSTFLEMLSLVPNAEHLVFDYVQTWQPEVQPAKKKRRVMSSDEDLNLYNLKKLEFQDCDDVMVVVFNRLPEGVLTELSFDNTNLNELNTLFKRQTNIKKLKIDWYAQDEVPATIPAEIFDNQQLEHLELDCESYNEQIINIEIVVSKQKKLKSLKLIDIIVGENLMNVVVNRLTDLETLLVNVSHMPIASLKNIKKMKNLRDFSLRTSGDDSGLTHIEEFAKLDNSRITTLEIQHESNLSANLITKLAKSVPKLKTLRFNCDYNLSEFNTIMESFNFVENLDFGRYYDHHHDQGNGNVRSLMTGDCFNPKLLQLNIVYTLPHKTPFLKKLIKNYPNLKKLVIESVVPLTKLQLKLILDGFMKIESLSLLLGASKLKINDLDFLEDHKTHLKFIELMDLEKMEFTDQVKDKLRTIFDVVICDDDEELQMAVDIQTMEREKV